MRKVYILVLCFLCFSNYAQVGITNSSPNFDEQPIAEGAVLELRSTDSGLLLPRLTQTQINDLAKRKPSPGLLVYNADTNQFLGWNGKEFQSIAMLPNLQDDNTENGSIPKTFGSEITRYFRKNSVEEYPDYLVVGSEMRGGSLNANKHFKFKSLKGSVVVRLTLSPYSEEEKSISMQIVRREGKAVNILQENKIEIPKDNFEYEYTFSEVPTDSYLSLKADSKMSRFKISSCEVVIKE